MTSETRITHMTRSPSQAEQWEQCPEQYRLRRIERVTPRPASWSYQGTAFHSAAEAHERSGRTMSREEVVDLFSDEYTALVNKALDKEPDLSRWMTAGKVDGGTDMANRYRLGQQQAGRYVEWAQEKGPRIWKAPDGTMGLELRLQAEIGGIPVQGIIDQLAQEPDGSVRVRDLKTGSTRSKFQLHTYTTLVRKVLGAEVNKADWWMGKTGGLSRALDVTQVTEQEVGKVYAALDEGVKAGNFPAKPGFNCRFCDVSHACNFF
ncbi:PD-(D/E)XK nuclease family protein [Streptomyces sp. CFMR 7]|uniref:RecB family exonuclease n=1 Tax=Streptomyces sp. CFMR 7 TaxID=1649184 RepID=UPI0021B51DAE|nr:PD-(D/E)XK nuclease family protein [Streptomyces sp. CFMR 7]